MLDLHALGPLFEEGADRNAVDRMLLALAVHPGGGAMRRVHLLVWAPDRERLEGWLSWTPAGRAPLADALRTARRTASAATDVEGTRRLRDLPFAPGGLEPLLAAAWESGEPVAGEPRRGDPAPWSAAAGIGVVRLARAGRPYGLLVGERADAAGRPDARLARLRDGAATVLDAHARAEACRRSRERTLALEEIGACGVSSLNLAEVLQVVVRAGSRGAGARGACVWLAEGDALRLDATAGPLGVRDRVARHLGPAAQRVATSRQPVELPAGPGFEAALLVPAQAQDRVAGVFALFDRNASHPHEGAGFDVEDRAYAASVAVELARLAGQARREEAARALERRARELERRLALAERTARLGEMALRAADEARNPVASIAAFARRVQRGLGEDDPHREYLDVVIREAERLERGFEEQARLRDVAPSGLRMTDLNTLVQEAVQRTAETLVRRRVRLLKRLSPEVPRLLLDAVRVRRVLENVLDHALESVAPGGRVRVESRPAGRHVVVEIAHDGPRPPGDLLERLFVPFAAERGRGLGLAVAEQVVAQHGGEVRVRAEGEWGCVLQVTLPVGGNEDRRRRAPDRRSRAERRGGAPAA